jgi:hypothetical protein
MIGILIAVLIACLAYALVIAITGSGILALVAAVLVLLAGVPTGGFGFGGRWGRGTRY